MVATERTATCAECDTETAADGERGGVCAGRLLCSDCADAEVVFHAECLDCDWSATIDGRAYNWYHLRQRAQQEGNNHEDKQRVFEGESHETVWRRVHDLSEEVSADV